jgi:rhomboid protease GluP
MNTAYPPPPSEPGGIQGPQFGEPYPAGGQGRPQPRYIEATVVRPLVTYGILAITVLVYLAQMASARYLGGDLPAALGMKVNQAILQGQLWRLLTPVLLHGSILHLGFNMYALYALGPTLEGHYGHTRYLALYGLAGFAGNVLSFRFTEANSLGSSTAIFGLLGAYGVFLYQNRKLLGGRAQRGLINIITIAIINLAIGMTPGSQIDNWGHIGGLAGGTIFAWIGGPKLQVEMTYASARMVDERQPRDVWMAGAAVLLVFGGILAVTVLF